MFLVTIEDKDKSVTNESREQNTSLPIDEDFLPISENKSKEISSDTTNKKETDTNSKQEENTEKDSIEDNDDEEDEDYVRLREHYLQNSFNKTSKHSLFRLLSKKEMSQYPPVAGYCFMYILWHNNPLKKLQVNPSSHKIMTPLRFGLSLAFLVILFLLIAVTQAIYVVHSRVYGDTFWPLQLMGITTNGYTVPIVVGLFLDPTFPIISVTMTSTFLFLLWGLSCMSTKRISIMRAICIIFAIYCVVCYAGGFGDAVGYAILAKQVAEGRISSDSTRLYLKYSPQNAYQVVGIDHGNPIVTSLRFSSYQQVIWIAIIFVILSLLIIFVISRLPGLQASASLGSVALLAFALSSIFPADRGNKFIQTAMLVAASFIFLWLIQGDLKSLRCFLANKIAARYSNFAVFYIFIEFLALFVFSSAFILHLS